MPLVLVVGFGEDTGKTTVAASLVSALRASGFRAEAFKPVGATRVWLHPSVAQESRERGYLVTWDGMVLARASGGDPERVNPVGGLVAPRDPFAGRGGYGESLAALRVSDCRGSRVHLYEPRSLEAAPPSIASLVREALSAARPGPVPVRPGGLMEVVEGPAVEAADSCLRLLLSQAEVVVAESNSDVAAPTPLAARPDLVVAVSPGRAAVYRGDRWALALQLVASGRPHAAVTGEVARLVEPLKVVDLPIVGDPLEGVPRDFLEPILDEVKGLASLKAKSE